MCIEFGKRLRELRCCHGISQEELAVRSHVSRVILSRIETGKSEPGLTTIKKLARALNVAPSSLLEGMKLGEDVDYIEEKQVGAA